MNGEMDLRFQKKFVLCLFSCLLPTVWGLIEDWHLTQKEYFLAQAVRLKPTPRPTLSNKISLTIQKEPSIAVSVLYSPSLAVFISLSAVEFPFRCVLDNFVKKVPSCGREEPNNYQQENKPTFFGIVLQLQLFKTIFQTKVSVFFFT